MTLNKFDLTPFYRNSVGIDRLSRLFDEMDRRDLNAGNYPPYNIIAKDENHYVIEMAVAGFGQEDIAVTANNGQLVVTGEKKEETVEEGEVLHRGISARQFVRTFQLDDYVEVKDAELKDGILVIALERVLPDSLKPKHIEVRTS